LMSGPWWRASSSCNSGGIRARVSSSTPLKKLTALRSPGQRRTAGRWAGRRS